MRNVMKCFWTLTLFFVAIPVSASEIFSDADIWTAVKKARMMAKKYGPEKVLFVSDLDNTLLKTKQDLASEPWFEWQEGLTHEQKDENRIACDVPDLLHFFHVSISLSQLEPVQDDQHKAIQAMQHEKISTMAMTARGEAVASATFRELAKNKIDFSITSPLGDGYPELHRPWKLSDLAASGLTQADVDKLKLGESRDVLYQRGVFYSDGQNKGALLKSFLHKAGRKYQGIVFWDNSQKNAQRVFDAFEGTGVEVYSIRASRRDADIADFNSSDARKQKATEDFVLLRKLLDDAYLYKRPCVLPIDKLVKTE